MERTRTYAAVTATCLALALIALLAAPRSVWAFDVEGVGGKLGYNNPEDLDGTASVAVHAEFEKSGSRVHVLPNMMYWNVNGVRDVNPNVDAYYHFRPEGRVSPYLGGGLGMNFIHNDRRDESSSDLGMNVMGGVRIPGASNHYFVEGRYTASDVTQVSVLTGVTFHGR